MESAGARSTPLPRREAEIIAEADVVVAGGGPAGLGAALAAARLGARVVLCERYGFLGGNLTVAAVGTAAAIAARDGVAVARVPVDELRATLEEHGAVLG